MDGMEAILPQRIITQVYNTIAVVFGNDTTMHQDQSHFGLLEDNNNWTTVAMTTTTTTTVTSNQEQSIRLLESPSKRRPSNVSIGSRRSSLALPRQEKDDIFSGTYEFEKYDDNLEEYLDSLGLPGRDIGGIVRQTKIRIELKKPKASDEKWTLTTFEYCDGNESSTTFSYDLDKPASNSRNGTVEITTVTRPQENMLVYTSKVPSNSWNVENSTVFTSDGIVATLRNLNSNVTTTKYYKRKS